MPIWGRLQIKMFLSWGLGFFGADRFYDQQVGWGVLKLLTLGGVGIWWLIDAILVTLEAGEKGPTT